MKPLQPYPHAILDYIVGLFLIVSPWLFRFSFDPAGTNTMVTIGIITVVLSLLTDYPLGLIKVVPFPVHGVLETLGAIVLLVSPWLFGFSDIAAATRIAVVVSIAWLVVVALTNYSYRTEERRAL